MLWMGEGGGAVCGLYGARGGWGVGGLLIV